MIGFIRRLFLKITLFFACIFFSLWFLFATQPGSTLTLRIISIATQSAFDFSSIEGALLNKFILHDATYSTDKFSLFTKSLAVEWEPAKLFEKTLLVNTINGDDIIITTSELAPHNTQTTPEFKLPFYVDIKSSQLNHISITYQDKHQIDIQTLTSTIVLDKKIAADIDIQTDSTEISHIKLHANGSYSDYLWTIALAGTQTDWEISGLGNHQGITFSTPKTKLLNTTADAEGLVHWLPNLTWDIALQTKLLNLSYFSQDLQKISLDLNTSGSPDHFNVETQLTLDKASLTIRGKLSDHWDIAYQLNSGELAKFFTQTTGHIESKGTITGPKFAPILTADFLTKSLTFDFLPDTTIDSILNIRANGVFNQNTLTAFSSQTNIKNIDLQHYLDGKKINIPANGSFNITLDQKGLNNTLSLFLYRQKNNFIHTILHLPNYTSLRSLKDDERVNGELKMSIQQLSPLQLLFPNISSLKGIFKSDLQIKGSLQHPLFSGNAFLENVNFYLPDLAIKPLVNLVIRASNDSLNYSGNIVSGDGKLILEGTSIFSNDTSTKIAISGENFLLSNLLKNKLIISPNVQLENRENQWRMTGRILVPKAYFDFGDARTTATLPSHTVIILPDGKIQTYQPLQLLTHLDVIAGNDVSLIFNGLTGKLRGSLLLQHADTQMIANGQITLNGTYDLMGEELSIQDGALSFNHSPIEDPALNIRGSKQIILNNSPHNFTNPQTLTVGVLVQGTADTPHVSLFSDPASWSQSDILSLILLGQPASTVSGTDAQLLFKAAQLLSPQKGPTLNKLKAQLQRKFGLTDLRIENSLSNTDNPDAAPEKSTSVVVGKSISPRLYLSYSVNIFNALNTFRLKYLLGKHWFIQTQTNTEGSGADLFYTLEK